MFLCQLLDALDFPCHMSTPIHCDNDTATCLAEDQVFHSQVKHIRVKLHAICKYIDLGELEVTRVCSANNITDILTKALGCPDFLRLRGYLGLHDFTTCSM